MTYFPTGIHDLAEWRHRSGITRRDLAAALDVPQVTLARWEQGDGQPPHSTALRLMEMMRADASENLALAKLMAPILSFTADELWRMLPKAARKDSNALSIHLAPFPEADPGWMDAQLAQRWERLLRVREAVQGSLELSRGNKTIGSSLEAGVSVGCVPDLYALLKEYEQELPSLFIVSQVTLKADPELPSDKQLAMQIGRADGKKCERCWNYRPAVGTFNDHPTLCDRCVEAVQ